MGQVALMIDGEETALGLEFADSMTFEQWTAEGRRLSQMSYALQWYIGDWWNAGVKFGDERRAETAKRLFGLEYGTVRNYGSVAAKFTLSHRNDNLPFTHYMALASLPAETIPDLIQKAVDRSLTVKALQDEVRAIKAANDPRIGAIDGGDSALRAKLISHELMEAYSRFAELADEIQKFRPLERREADYLTLVLDKLGEAYDERSPVPDDFRIVFREQGRLECERVFGASRLTVNRWMKQCGGQELKDERAAFVKFQRAMNKTAEPGRVPVDHQVDTYLPVARLAADFLRIRRNGGWVISKCQDGGGWFVGTVRRSSEEVIGMAVNQGFDREAAVMEARQEGY